MVMLDMYVGIYIYICTSQLVPITGLDSKNLQDTMVSTACCRKVSRNSLDFPLGRFENPSANLSGNLSLIISFYQILSLAYWLIVDPHDSYIMIVFDPIYPRHWCRS